MSTASTEKFINIELRALAPDMTPCDLSAVHTKSSSSRPRTGPRSPGRGRAHAGAGGCAKSTRTDPSRRRLSRGASRQPSSEIGAAATKIRGVRERSAPSTALSNSDRNTTRIDHYRNASRLRDWALRGRGRRTGGVFDLESTLGRRLGVKRDLELTLKSVKNLRCAESST